MEYRLWLIIFIRFPAPGSKLLWSCQLPPQLLIKLLTASLLCRDHLFLSPLETQEIILPSRLVLMPRVKPRVWGRGVTRLMGDREAL